MDQEDGVSFQMESDAEYAKMKEHVPYDVVKAKLQEQRPSPWAVFDMLDWIASQTGSYEWAVKLTVGQLVGARKRASQSKDKQTSKYLKVLDKFSKNIRHKQELAFLIEQQKRDDDRTKRVRNQMTGPSYPRNHDGT